MTRTGWLVGLVCVVACDWSSPDLIDGTFTPEQWAAFQQRFKLPDAPRCNLPGAQIGEAQCADAQELGEKLFWDKSLSCDPVVMPAGCTPMACADCHDAKRGFVDSRTPDNVSLASGGWTKRNSMTVLGVGYKEWLAQQLPASRQSVFTWSGGRFTSAGQVLDLAITVPMKSSHHHVAQVFLNNPTYVSLYETAFSLVPGTDDDIFRHLERAMDAYLASLTTNDTPFDLWLRGDTSSTMSDSAKRGFAIFVGKGTCVECHDGPLFSDLDFHCTGVPQTGDHVPDSDVGRGSASMNPDDIGKFLTGTLRDISATGPYMHDGAFGRLRDVIAFYRNGGVADGYSGTRDPRITPLDLTDDDANDLEAFLRSLSDNDCDDGGGSNCMGSGSGMGSGSPPPDAGVPDAVTCSPPTMMLCGSVCVDIQVDPMNCGACAHPCTYPTPNCMMGVCGP